MTKTILVDGKPTEVTTAVVLQTQEYTASGYCPSCRAMFTRKARTEERAVSDIVEIIKRHIAEVCVS